MLLLNYLIICKKGNKCFIDINDQRELAVTNSIEVEKEENCLYHIKQHNQFVTFPLNHRKNINNKIYLKTNFFAGRMYQFEYVI